MGNWRTGCTCMAALGVLLATLLAGACTRAKKLSGEDDSIFDEVVHGVLNQDRDAEEYYEIVRSSHDRRFGYKVTEDKFLIDKTVDAVQRLGKLEYDRLEGQARVVSLLADVLLEDPSALARANAANSLVRLSLRGPQNAPALVPERGDRMLALVREMDGLHSGGRRPTAAGQRRTVTIVQQVGRFELPTAAIAKDALTPFYTRTYLVNTTDGALRRAADEALVLRMRDLTRLALRAAVDAETDFVREEAVRGLKTLRDTRAEPVVLRRLAREPVGRVRAEIVEYLGITSSAQAVATLVPLLEDPDPTLRHKARQSLTRIAGRDLGFRRVTWTRWARQRYPELAQPAVDGPSQPTPGMR